MLTKVTGTRVPHLRRSEMSWGEYPARQKAAGWTNFWRTYGACGVYRAGICAEGRGSIAKKLRMPRRPRVSEAELGAAESAAPRGRGEPRRNKAVASHRTPY